MTRLVLSTSLALALCLPAESQGAVAYDSIASPFGGSFAVGGEHGDQVSLNGDNRIVSEFRFRYSYQDGAAHVPSGNETVVVRFYANDGIGGAPESLLYQSPPVPLPYFVFPGADLTIAGLSVLVPDPFTWTIEIFGLETFNEHPFVGTSGPPEVGGNDQFIWVFDSPAAPGMWSQDYFLNTCFPPLCGPPIEVNPTALVLVLSEVDCVNNVDDDADLLVDLADPDCDFLTEPPFLTSPLGSSPYLDGISAVYDHSNAGALVRQRIPYTGDDSDNTVLAFNFESGQGNPKGSPPCFDAGTPIQLFGNYVVQTIELLPRPDHLCYEGHSGIDYELSVSSPVVASAAGDVSVWCPCLSCNSTCGTGDSSQAVSMRIDHGNGLVSGYGHLSQIEAKFMPAGNFTPDTWIDVGVPAASNEKLGESGSTGTSLPHLHFGVKVEATGALVDPYGLAGAGNLWLLPCADGIDNDNDGTVDWDGGISATGSAVGPPDPHCVSPTDRAEVPNCSDNLDNDNDGKTDFGSDLGCITPLDGSESNRACGLGFEVVLLVPLLLSRRRGRAHQ